MKRILKKHSGKVLGLCMLLTGIGMMRVSGCTIPGEGSDPLLEAGMPAPADNFHAVRLPLRELKWTPGRFAVGQQVYFGVRREDVANGRKCLLMALKGNAVSCRLTDS
ncbi:MAG TPA: hypothetical protein VHD83_08060, partial [Puia sp.]|nr:hypothetical protein [Puia sp.]